MARYDKTHEVVNLALSNASGNEMQTLDTAKLITPYSLHAEGEELREPTIQGYECRVVNHALGKIRGKFVGRATGATVTRALLYFTPFTVDSTTGEITYGQRQDLCATHINRDNTVVDVSSITELAVLHYRVEAVNVYGTFYSEYMPVVIVGQSCVDKTDTNVHCYYDSFGYRTDLFPAKFVTHTLETTQYSGVGTEGGAYPYLSYTEVRYPLIDVVMDFSAPNIYGVVPYPATMTDEPYSCLKFDTGYYYNTERPAMPITAGKDTSMVPCFNMVPNRTINTGTYVYKGVTQNYFATPACTVACFGMDRQSENVYFYFTTQYKTAYDIKVNLSDTEYFEYLQMQGAYTILYVKDGMPHTLPQSTTSGGWRKVNITSVLDHNMQIQSISLMETETSEVTTLTNYWTRCGAFPTYGTKILYNQWYEDMWGHYAPHTFTL